MQWNQFGRSEVYSMGIVSFIKGVIQRMFGTDEIKNALSVESYRSYQMSIAIDTWQMMLFGNACWVDNTSVWSLGLEQAICREFANVVTNEIEAYITNEKLDLVFQKSIPMLNEQMQKGLAYGEFVIKPINESEFEFVLPGNYIPIAYDPNGRLINVIFFEEVKKNKMYYKRFEQHVLEGELLTITNRAFVSKTSDRIGEPTSLESIDKWLNIAEEAKYQGVKGNVFGYYKNPFMNTVDGSSCGQSAFESAKYIIQSADEQFGTLKWEFKSGERAIHIAEDAVRKTQLASGRTVDVADCYNDRLYRVANTHDTDFFKDFSPRFRDQSIINGLEEYKRDIEFSVGLAYGDLSKVSDVAKTATEIKSSKQRKYDTVNQIEENLKKALIEFSYAIAFYNELTLSGYETIITFRDSILTDEKEERQQDREDLAIGAMQLVHYRMKHYNEDEATARANIISEQGFDNSDGTDAGMSDGNNISTAEVAKVAEDTVNKTLNGAQTQSLITIISQLQSGVLTIGQAINMVSIAIGITREEAEKLINGTT